VTYSKPIILIITIILLLISEYVFLTHFYYKPINGGKLSLTTTNSAQPIYSLNLTLPKYQVIQSIPEKDMKYMKNTTIFDGNPDHVYFIPVITGYFLINVTGAVVIPPSIYSDIMIVVTSGPMNLQTRALNQLVGCVYAINISNGQVVWADKFPNQIMTEPIIVNGEVIIGLGNAMFINSTVRGTGENAVIALSLYSGKELWNFTTLGEDMPTPVYYDGMIIEANGNGEVFALNATTGKLVWEDYIGSYDSMSSPVLVNNVIYFGSANPYIFWAIDAKSGKVLWYYNFSSYEQNLGGLDDSSPAYSDGIVVTSYTIHINNENMVECLVAFNADNGKIIWALNEGVGPIPPYLESPPPVIFNGIVFHDSPVGILYAVNLSSGKVIWEYKTGFTTSNVDIIKGKYVVIQNETGYLFVFTLSGKLVKLVKTPVMPGPGNLLVTLNSLILVGVNGIIDVIPIDSII